MSMSNRFKFGENWENYLGTVDTERIDEAKKSLREWLEMEDLSGKTFLDIGSGSGLFSLAARMLGATVHSFDYDESSVKCTGMLKERFFPNDLLWSIERGDVLSREYLSKYAEHDIVYSWGVLHHTGNMKLALQNAGEKVKVGGKLFIAIYNDQGSLSEFWRKEKRFYNHSPYPVQMAISSVFFAGLWTKNAIVDLLNGKPFEHWRSYKKKRGMSPWHDAVDWVGGYPFEVASPEQIFEFYHKRGFVLEKIGTRGGKNGCNQYVFSKKHE